MARLVAADSGLCASLLFLANCSCYARNPDGKSVETVPDALDAVDVQSLAAMVGTSYAFRTVETELAPPRKQWTDYVRHSREISSICTILAELAGLTAPQQERYTVAGLTHDIGRVVIMVAAQNTSASLLGTSPDQMASIVADEEAAYGMDHCRIGHALFRRWGFSDDMQAGILRHHAPLLKQDFCFPGGLIFVSHFVTMSDFTGAIIAKMLPAELLRRLGLTAAEMDRARNLCALRAQHSR